MPKDPKRNIQNYQIEGRNLNEFEYAKNQEEIAQAPEMPFKGETGEQQETRAEHIADVTAEAHKKVEKRLNRRKTSHRKSASASKRKPAQTKAKKR
jgi:hypothetical protein